jgi:hypothetical protein
MTGLTTMDASVAFSRARRGRRLAALRRRLRRGEPGSVLPLFDERVVGAAVPARGRREIPLDAIAGTLEPSRAGLFDASFRPAGAARSRWERVWAAEQRGVALPPIAVVPVSGGFAVRDGHHRVSVARARGALTIDAEIDAPVGA